MVKAKYLFVITVSASLTTQIWRDVILAGPWKKWHHLNDKGLLHLNTSSVSKMLIPALIKVATIIYSKAVEGLGTI